MWSLAPVAALINNVLEVRFDAFKVLRETRRPVPREDTGIDAWLTLLQQSIMLSLPIVAGMAVLATGGVRWGGGQVSQGTLSVVRDWLTCFVRSHLCCGVQLEWWMFAGCHLGWDPANTIMGPDWACFSSWHWRLLAGVIIERIGVFMVHTIMSSSDMATATKRKVAAAQRKKMRVLQNTLLPAVSADLSATLKYLFDKYVDVWMCVCGFVLQLTDFCACVKKKPTQVRP